MKRIAPPSPPFIPARWHGGAQTPKAVVIHGTVTPCNGSAGEGVAAFFHREDNKTSAHYVTDSDSNIQTVKDHVVAYHCGYNQSSIGHELCDPQAGPDNRWFDKPHTAMLARAAKLDARLALAYGIETRKVSVDELKAKGPHGFYGHNDSRLAFGNTTHSDPGDAFPWDTYMDTVRTEAKRLRGKLIDRPAKGLTAIGFNLERDRQTDVVLAELTQLVEQYHPDFLVLQECLDYWHQLATFPGYTMYADSKTPGGYETVILVRDDHKARRPRFKSYGDGWTTTRGGHAPARPLPRVTIEWLRVAGIHKPPASHAKGLGFEGPPERNDDNLELMQAVERFLRFPFPRARAVDGDWNDKADNKAHWAPRTTAVRAGGHIFAADDGIDYTAAIGVHATTVKLHKFPTGSDHLPVLVTFTKE